MENTVYLPYFRTEQDNQGESDDSQDELSWFKEEQLQKISSNTENMHCLPGQNDSAACQHFGKYTTDQDMQKLVTHTTRGRGNLLTIADIPFTYPPKRLFSTMISFMLNMMKSGVLSQI